MKNDAYSGYSYRRPHKPLRIFIIVTIVALIAVILLVANLVFNFVKISPDNGTNVILPGSTVWAIEVDSFGDKDNAFVYSREVRNQGGAGFVISNDSWRVLENTYVSKADAERQWNALDGDKMPNARVRQFSCENRNITLKNQNHKAVFDKIINSFNDNFVLFNEYLVKVRSGETGGAEVAAVALQKYNELNAAVSELDQIQIEIQDEFYASTLLYANKQLLSLYLLSTEGTSSNFTANLTNCICNIIFAYIDLAAS